MCLSSVYTLGGRGVWRKNYPKVKDRAHAPNFGPRTMCQGEMERVVKPSSPQWSSLSVAWGSIPWSCLHPPGHVRPRKEQGKQEADSGKLQRWSRKWQHEQPSAPSMDTEMGGGTGWQEDSKETSSQVQVSLSGNILHSKEAKSETLFCEYILSKLHFSSRVKEPWKLTD